MHSLLAFILTFHNKWHYSLVQNFSFDISKFRIFIYISFFFIHSTVLIYAFFAMLRFLWNRNDEFSTVFSLFNSFQLRFSLDLNYIHIADSYLRIQFHFRFVKFHFSEFFIQFLNIYKFRRYHLSIAIQRSHWLIARWRQTSERSNRSKKKQSIQWWKKNFSDKKKITQSKQSRKKKFRW